MSNSGIYRIVHIPTGKEYVGHSCRLARRIQEHQWMLNGGRHHSPILQNFWDKYGRDEFAFEILEHCDRSQLVEREQWHINHRKPSFNIAPSAGSRAGVPQSESAKEKIRAKIKGHIKSDQTRKRLSNALAGRTLSPEHCAKIRQIKSAISDETRSRMRASHLGKRASVETKEKMSAAQKGKKLSQEHREKISKAFKGRTFSEETRRRMSAAQVAYRAKLRGQS